MLRNLITPMGALNTIDFHLETFFTVFDVFEGPTSLSCYKAGVVSIFAAVFTTKRLKRMPYISGFFEDQLVQELE